MEIKKEKKTENKCIQFKAEMLNCIMIPNMKVFIKKKVYSI